MDRYKKKQEGKMDFEVSRDHRKASERQTEISRTAYDLVVHG